MLGSCNVLFVTAKWGRFRLKATAVRQSILSNWADHFENPKTEGDRSLYKNLLDEQRLLIVIKFYSKE